MTKDTTASASDSLQKARGHTTLKNLAELQSISEKECFPYWTDEDRINEISMRLPDVSAYVTTVSSELERVTAENAKLLADWRRMREVLKEIEWQAHSHFCYVCTRAVCDGHIPACPVGKVLSSLSYQDSPTAHD